LKLAAQGNLIPVTRRMLADIETPLSAYRKIRGAGRIVPVRIRRRRRTLGRYSFVGCNPRAVIRQTGNRVEVIENGKVTKVLNSRLVRRRAGSRDGHLGAASDVKRNGSDGLEVVERVMKKYRAVALPGLPRFTGGAVGFIGYEFIHDVEPVVPRPPQDELKRP
jgi:anthranilate synthase component I